MKDPNDSTTLDWVSTVDSVPEVETVLMTPELATALNQLTNATLADLLGD